MLALDRFEQEQQEFFWRVDDSYLVMAEEHSQRYRVIDTSQTEQVQFNLSKVMTDRRIVSVSALPGRKYRGDQ